MRHAVYDETIGSPLVYRTLRDALEARDLLRESGFPGANTFRVYPYESRAQVGSGARSGGSGGLWKNQYDQIVVLSPIDRHTEERWARFLEGS